MSYFEFPHTRNYDGDLGYILKKLEELNERYNNFFDYNSIRFHDPITWDISTVYPAWNIVFDNQSKSLYISKTAVPAGIDINNKDFWELVSPFKIDTTLDINSINPIANRVVTVNINNINADITALNNALQTEITTRSNQYSDLDGRIANEYLERTNEDNTLSARIDELEALPDGSTTADAELVDIRVGANGITYSTAGNAVRGQFADVKSTFDDNNNRLDNGFYGVFPTMVLGTLSNTGSVNPSTIAMVTNDFQPVEDIDYQFYMNDPLYSIKIVIYDSDKEYLDRFYYSYSDFINNRVINFKTYNANAYYYKFNIQSSDPVTNPVYGDGAYLIKKLDILADVELLRNKTLNYTVGTTSQNGYLTANDTYTGTTTYHSITSKLLAVEAGMKFEYKGVGKYSGVSYIMYDSSSIVTTGQIDGAGTVTIPSGVSYIKFSSYAPIDDDVIFEVTPITLEYRLDRIDENDPLLTGYKIGLDGDSICYGKNNNGGYSKILEDDYGADCENLGVSGGTIASGTYYDPDTPRHWICDSVANISSDNDYIIVEGGINDVINNVPLGSISSGYNATLDTSTFYGALETIAKTLITTFTGKKVAFLIVHKIRDQLSSPAGDYYKAIIEVMDKWGVLTHTEEENTVHRKKQAGKKHIKVSAGTVLN